MCIAIYKAKGLTIAKENLEECFKRNSDGAGFSYIKDGQLRVHKGYFNFKSFYGAYRRLEQEQMLIHFRIKTHGAVAIENCHPFFVRKDLAFIHNGIISQHSGNSSMSDTKDFNEVILKPLVNEFGTTIISSPTIKKMLEDYIGYSKLIFLDNEGNYTIINEHKGFWDEGIWYSNQSYKIYKPTAIVPATTTYRGKTYYGGHTTTHSPRKNSNNNVYCLERAGGRIYENCKAKVYLWNSHSVPTNTIVTVRYILAQAFCDVELANGIIITNFPTRCLDYVEPETVLASQSLFDDSFTDEEVRNNFQDANPYKELRDAY